jgi:uncharacterized RDD family membrane protein YckC
MRQPDNEPLLFDLPLDRPPRGDGPDEAHGERQGGSRATAGTRGPRPQASAPPADSVQTARQRQRSKQADGAGLFDIASSARAGSAPGGTASAKRAAATPSGRPAQAVAAVADLPGTPGTTAEEPAARIGVGRRAASGLADLLVHLAVGIVALAGCRYLGVTPDVRDWPALTVFLLSFSFLYTVVPLAFWGHTLGMTWAGLTSQSNDGEPLSFDQTARRWLGMLLTLAALGLPLLLALTGRSLVDRMSDSSTLQSV